MTINLPTDGFGVYESISSSLGSGTWGPRLDQIAAGGFKLVLNYGLLFGSIAQITSYINYAASKGLKVIVAIHNAVIWDTVGSPTSADLAAEYPTIYAAAGSPTSNWSQVFGQYVVHQLKSLPGVWGWYIGDEVTTAQHAQLLSYASFIAAADATHPRLIVGQGNSANAAANASANYYDCCDVTGDDYYFFGSGGAAPALSTAQTAAGTQAFCAAHGLGSAIVLQAFNWSQYGRSSGVWPSQAQMQQSGVDALTNMTPRLVLFYSYYNTIDPATAPANQWSLLTGAVSNIVQGPVVGTFAL